MGLGAGSEVAGSPWRRLWDVLRPDGRTFESLAPIGRESGVWAEAEA